MKRYLYLFSQHSIYDLNKNSLLKPNVSYCQEEDHLHYNPIDYSKEYLTFDILTDGVIYWIHDNSNAQRTISYSLDGGNTWTNITSGNYSNPSSINVSAGDKVLFKGTNTEYTLAWENNYSASFYNSTASFNVYGNILSLFYGDNFANETEFPEVQPSYVSCGPLFGHTKVVDASKLILLPMTLSEYCYDSMFSNCTDLTKAPELPALTLSNYCYLSMFYGCTSLILAPELPATTLADSCYDGMFWGCTSLVNAPQLPATTLANSCYNSMFRGCTSLNYIKAMFTTTPGNNYTGNWVDGVAANGTFVKNSTATWNVSGINGVPSGWTVETASE